uniref:Uncharacterized protein TCIL3000_11_12050 n=1 Tax=Trypanosoma congolense (strain IL3000) TaxID=1068625 RepID=G0V240_TRYCI|nr:unnamed protein product [Trypanosoma congolense IL3000]
MSHARFFQRFCLFLSLSILTILISIAQRQTRPHKRRRKKLLRYSPLTYDTVRGRGAMRKSLLALEKLTRYVSFRYAPKFRQPRPDELVGVPSAQTPPDCVPAFVIPDFISETEERAILAVVEPWFSRLPYNDGHVDALIHNYKEFYRSYRELAGESGSCGPQQAEGANENVRCMREALGRCRSLAAEYVPAVPIGDRVHFLRLSGDGFIRAHADDTRNSSGIIAGLCLGSARVMTLTHPNHPGQRIELMLAPRAFYVLTGAARYKWEHSTDWVEDTCEHDGGARNKEVAEGTPLIFDGRRTEFVRGERTAVIFRGVSPMELFKLKVLQRRNPE